MLDFEQYIDIFLDESKEHLQNLNQNLLNFEEDTENLETVNEIFRIAHTLKGMSATMGFETIASLTHKMENILDGIRSKKMTVNPGMIDILFEGLDILDSQIKNIENTGKEIDMDISDILSRLDKIEKGEDISAVEIVTKNEVDNDSIQSSYNQDDVVIHIQDGQLETIKAIGKNMADQGFSIFKIKVELEKTTMLKAARAFLIFRTLEERGEVVYSDPSADDIEDEKFDTSFSVLFSTQNSPEEIVKAIEDISEVEKVTLQIFDTETDTLKTPAKQEDGLTALTHEDREENTSLSSKSKQEQGEKAQDNRKNKAGKTVRVDIDRLDNLMNLVSELIIVKTRLEDDEISNDHQTMGEAIEYLERITTNLHDAVTKVRMVPVERVFSRFPRMIRDLSKELKKEIDLFMSGEETEVDRTVIDEIGDPLIHLLRNSIDHGIEVPEDRIAKGKSEKGRVNLIAYPDGNTVVIEVSDDGAGINIEKVKEKAISKNIISMDQLQEMDANRIAELIFEPGFSTADQISDISGRGVGLDVVKTKIEALGGIVEIETEQDKGSRFIIRLPLTLAIIQALLVIAGKEKYAIPLNNIKEITDIAVSDIRMVENKEVILYRNNPLPLVRLSSILESDIQEEMKEYATVVIVKKGEKEIGVIVEKLIGQQEIVIKSLGKYLSNIREIAGATILGNGGVALIIDTNSLF